MREPPIFVPSGKSLAPIGIAAGVLALVAVLFLAGKNDLWSDPSLDPLSAFAKMRHVAGEGAVACGQVPLGMDATAMVECVEAAIRDKRPFWAARETRGIDSRLWIGYTRSREGRQYVVLYDHDASGGWANVRKPFVYVNSCPRIVTRHEGRLGPWCVVKFEGHETSYP